MGAMITATLVLPDEPLPLAEPWARVAAFGQEGTRDAYARAWAAQEAVRPVPPRSVCGGGARPPGR